MPVHLDVHSRPENERLLWLQWDLLKLENGVLQRDYVWGPQGAYVGSVLVLPEIYRAVVFQRAHLTDTQTHLSWTTTLQRLHRQVYWPGMKEDVQQWIYVCEWCRPPHPQADQNLDRIGHLFRVTRLEN